MPWRRNSTTSLKKRQAPRGQRRREDARRCHAAPLVYAADGTPQSVGSAHGERGRGVSAARKGDPPLDGVSGAAADARDARESVWRFCDLVAERLWAWRPGVVDPTAYAQSVP